MGLRDRLSANYFIPLVAGVDSASRSGLLAPADVYGPGLDQGGGLGGIGAGDGGEQTPDDPTVNKPSITSPEDGGTATRTATATSSAFGSTDSQTHLKSRWVIEYRGEAGDSTDPAAFVVFDSGPTSDDLTSLDMTDLLGADTRYAIKVRHKGSGGGWSPWSDYSLFNVVCTGEGTSTTYDTTIMLWWWDTGSGTHGYLDPVQGCRDRFGGVGTYTSPSGGECYRNGAYQGSLSQSPGCYRGEGVITTIDISGSPGAPCSDPYVVTTPGEETCDDLPELPDEPVITDPPPPVFVPPSSQPPVPPPLPGVPPAQAKFAKIVVDLSQSLVQGIIPNGTFPSTSLKKVIADGGVAYAALSPARLALVFQNTGTAPGCINYFVSSDSESAEVHRGDYTAGEAGYDFGPATKMTAPRELCLDPKKFKVVVLTLWMPTRPIPPETHEFTIDIGDGTPLKFKVGFGQDLIETP